MVELCIYINQLHDQPVEEVLNEKLSSNVMCNLNFIVSKTKLLTVTFWTIKN